MAVEKRGATGFELNAQKTLETSEAFVDGAENKHCILSSPSDIVARATRCFSTYFGVAQEDAAAWEAVTRSGRRIPCQAPVHVRCFDRSKIAARGLVGIIILFDADNRYMLGLTQGKVTAVLDLAGWYGLIDDDTIEIIPIIAKGAEDAEAIDELLDMLKVACGERQTYVLYNELRLIESAHCAIDPLIDEQDLSFQTRPPAPAGLFRYKEAPVESAAPTQQALDAERLAMTDERKRLIAQIRLLALADEVCERILFAYEHDGSVERFLDEFGAGCIKLSPRVSALLRESAMTRDIPVRDGFIERNFCDEYASAFEREIAGEIFDLIRDLDIAAEIWERVVLIGNTLWTASTNPWWVFSKEATRQEIIDKGHEAGVDAYLRAALGAGIPLTDLLAGHDERQDPMLELQDSLRALARAGGAAWT